jgi:hypothetical protein
MRWTRGLAAFVLLLGSALAEDRKAPVDWTAHMGNLPFTVGMEKGREEVKFTGRPAMLFFTSATDPWCPKYAARTWKDKEVLGNVAGYTPVLIDADAAPVALKDKYAIAILPAVIWLDFDEGQVFMAMGDAPLELVRVASGVAKERCPESRPPAEGIAALQALRKKLDDAAKAKDVKAQLASIAEIRKVGVGAEVQAAARAADARLTKDGEAEVTRAKDLLAAKKKADARKAAEKLVADYGAEHPVAKAAQELLDQIAGKAKPRK